MTGRRGIRNKQLLDDLEEKRGYLKLEEEALDRTLWRTHFVRSCGPVVRQAAECVNCILKLNTISMLLHHIVIIIIIIICYNL